MINKKMTIREKILFYKIVPLLIFGIILLFAGYFTIKEFDESVSTNGNSGSQIVTPDMIYIAFLVVWLLISFSVIRNRRYYYLTGRNYGYDKSHYRPMTYSQLVDYFKTADPHKLDTSGFPQVKWQVANGIIFGMCDGRLIVIPSNSEVNIAVFGPPGSGKTSGLVIINALRFEGSVLAIDVKGDIYNFCKDERNIIRFCPDSPNALEESCHFDPLVGIKDMTVTERKLYIESMALVLIPNQEGSRDSYFEDTARIYFQGITHLLLYKDSNTTFPDIIHAILTGNCFDCVTEAMRSDCVEAKELLSSLYGNNEKNISGAYNTLCTAIKIFSNPVLDELLTCSGNCISIEALEGGKDVYLQISQEHLESYAPLFTLIVQSFSTAFTKRPDSSTGIKNRPILMLLDEFPALTYDYQLISSNLSTLRSKSVICMVIQQNLAQLKKRYEEDGTSAIIGNCHCQVILGSNDINSSKVFSETIGEHKILRISDSESSAEKKSNGRSIQEAREPVFYPEDFGDLGEDMVLYLKGKYCRCSKLNCYRDK